MNGNRPAGRIALLALLTCLSATACSKDERQWDPVEYGAVEPGAPALSIRVDPDDVLPASRWPSACQFLTDDEIRALLPQADSITRVPKAVSVVSLDAEQRTQAPEGSCHYEFWLRNVTIKDVTSSVTVSIAGIAGPSIISDHYGEQLAHAKTRTDQEPATDLGASLGPQACYTWRSTSKLFPTVVCRQGPLMYEISGSGYGQMTGVPDDDLVAKAEVWRDKVHVPVAQLIATKVPAAG